MMGNALCIYQCAIHSLPKSPNALRFNDCSVIMLYEVIYIKRDILHMNSFLYASFPSIKNYMGSLTSILQVMKRSRQFVF